MPRVKILFLTFDMGKKYLRALKNYVSMLFNLTTQENYRYVPTHIQPRNKIL